MIDLRSDTVTKPTPAMRKAMAEAEVGDDVYAEDPTVIKLQEKAAELFGKEAAIFMPTGSMGNQVAVKLHTRQGDEIIIEERGHIFNYEMGTPSVVSGVLIRPIRSENPNGILKWSDIEPALHINQPYYACPTGLICLENSHNLAGGTVMTAEHCEELCDKAHELGIPVHLDGARIFNASVALNTSVTDLSKKCDSVQFCLSKGLGAPVGSILVGEKDFINEARVWRKRFGGGMRQVGILAAAGLVALEESRLTLYQDHENARILAEGVANLKGVQIDTKSVQTNIVIFDVTDTKLSSNEICEKLKENDILAIPFGNQIRMVTHYDVSCDDIETTLNVLENILK
ncbi:MAG: aminotransferase class I/II-fold pyridoxal phosphate-dependent enzyme [Acidobacteriota bacterium]|jgi:threonine aldolase|nr:aminotransferase class I/II-fold pyridoxal phosphate-dependent enzyme [Acidobacteriota bacterium]